MHGIIIFFALAIPSVLVALLANMVRLVVAYFREVRYWKRARRDHERSCKLYRRRVRFNNVFS